MFGNSRLACRQGAAEQEAAAPLPVRAQSRPPASIPQLLLARQPACSPLWLVVQAGGGVEVDHPVVLGGQVVTGALQMSNLRGRGRAGQGKEGEKEGYEAVGLRWVVDMARQPFPSRTGLQKCSTHPTSTQRPALLAHTHLHEVPRHQRFADVCVVVLAGKVGGHQAHLQPRADARLRQGRGGNGECMKRGSGRVRRRWQAAAGAGRTHACRHTPLPARAHMQEPQRKSQHAPAGCGRCLRT